MDTIRKTRQSGDMTETTSPPPTQHPPRRLVRTHEDRMIAGVASGLADRTDVPLGLIRLAFIVLAFAGGIGIALYLAGWLLIPDEDSDDPLASTVIRRIDGGASWIGIALVGIAALIFLDQTNIFRGDLAAALVLGVIGVLLYRGDLDAPSLRTNSTKDEMETSSTTEPATKEHNIASATAPKAKRPSQPKAPRPPRETSNLGALTFALGLVTVGVMGVLDAAMTAFDPTPRHYWAAALLIAGLGLVVGAWLGRARGLIALGVILLPIVFLSPLADLDVVGTVGERRSNPETVVDIAEVYELGIGSLTLDLSDIDFAGETVRTRVELGIGELVVTVPNDINVTVEAETGIGELDILGFNQDGLGLDASHSVDGSNGTLHLTTDLGIGSNRVRLVTRSINPGDPISAVGDLVSTIRPVALAPDYTFGDGFHVLDLSDLDGSGSTVSRIQVDTGTLLVKVPDDLGTLVTAHVDRGVLSMLGSETAGSNLQANEVLNPLNGVEVELEIFVGDGVLIVEEGN